MKDNRKINKEWHLLHRMPKNASLDDRIKWHLEHFVNCNCRDMPAQISDEIRKRKLKLKQGG